MITLVQHFSTVMAILYQIILQTLLLKTTTIFFIFTNLQQTGQVSLCSLCLVGLDWAHSHVCSQLMCSSGCLACFGINWDRQNVQALSPMTGDSCLPAASTGLIHKSMSGPVKENGRTQDLLSLGSKLAHCHSH